MDKLLVSKVSKMYMIEVLLSFVIIFISIVTRIS